jgi:hypothetical protein
VLFDHQIFLDDLASLLILETAYSSSLFSETESKNIIEIKISSGCALTLENILRVYRVRFPLSSLLQMLG